MNYYPERVLITLRFNDNWETVDRRTNDELSIALQSIYDEAIQGKNTDELAYGIITATRDDFSYSLEVVIPFSVNNAVERLHKLIRERSNES